MVEVSCHGGLYITKRILRLIFEAGARPAEPGEFTKRAFLNGKIDLIKAESVMKIIEATGKNAARVAVAVNEGAISKKVEVIKNELLELSARLSVWADYPDDESIDVDFDSVKEILIEVKRKLEFLIKKLRYGKSFDKWSKNSNRRGTKRRKIDVDEYAFWGRKKYCNRYSWNNTRYCGGDSEYRGPHT